MARFIPVGNKILLKRLKTVDKTEGGIIIPEAAQERSSYGLVIACGEGVAMKIVAGQTIAFTKYAGVEIVIDNQSHTLINDIDVLGILEA